MHFGSQHPMVDFALRHGSAGVFAIVLIESMGIPLPGATILILAAAGAARRPAELNIWRVLLASIAGTTFGANLGYLIGFTQGTRFFDWLLARLGINPRRRLDAERAFARYGAWAVFFGRFFAGLRIFAGPLAGVLRLRWPVFALANFGGAVVWSGTFGGLAYTFAHHLERVFEILQQAGWVLSAALLAVLLGLGWFWRRRRANERGEKTE